MLRQGCPDAHLHAVQPCKRYDVQKLSGVLKEKKLKETGLSDARVANSMLSVLLVAGI